MIGSAPVARQIAAFSGEQATQARPGLLSADPAFTARSGERSYSPHT
ncbi:MAG TPA: hypothetical protein VGX23_24720 [Actinocrinis sp.]|nr:hypothetical protein [Actinocrinis sp.]